MGSFGYPICLELGGRRCVVVGGGAVAGQKVDGLLDGGGEVVVVSGNVAPGLVKLEVGGQISVIARDFRPGDLAGAFLAIAATDDPEVNAAVHEEAVASGVLVNSVDDIVHCQFSVPSIVRRGELTVAVSTGGRAPALSKKIRRMLSAQLGPEYAEVVELVGDVRACAQPLRAGLNFATWAARWEVGLDDEVIALVADGRREQARDRLLAALAGEPAPGSAAGPRSSS